MLSCLSPELGNFIVWWSIFIIPREVAEYRHQRMPRYFQHSHSCVWLQEIVQLSKTPAENILVSVCENPRTKAFFLNSKFRANIQQGGIKIHQTSQFPLNTSVPCNRKLCCSLSAAYEPTVSQKVFSFVLLHINPTDGSNTCSGDCARHCGKWTKSLSVGKTDEAGWWIIGTREF